MFKIFICIFILCVILSSSISFSDEMYTWTDEDGVMHFSNTPSQLKSDFNVKDMPENRSQENLNASPENASTRSESPSVQNVNESKVQFNNILAKYDIPTEYHDKYINSKYGWIKIGELIEKYRQEYIALDQKKKELIEKELPMRLKSAEDKLKKAEEEFEAFQDEYTSKKKDIDYMFKNKNLKKRVATAKHDLELEQNYQKVAIKSKIPQT